VIIMLPPPNRVDHKPTFIRPGSAAWNKQLIAAQEREIVDREATEAELAKARTAKPVPDEELVKALEQKLASYTAPWKTLLDHPVTRYWLGETRGDIETIREYLLPGVAPTMIVCRTLDPTPWADAMQLNSRGQTYRWLLHVVRFGVESIENAKDSDGRPLEVSSSGVLSDGDINKIKRLVGDDNFQMLGQFIWKATQEPGLAETFP
jgi:hypothetical protein